MVTLSDVVKNNAPTVRGEFHLACPVCGRDDKIDIVGNMSVRVTAFGGDPEKSEEQGAFGWDEESPARCHACDHVSTVKMFTIDSSDQKEPVVRETEFEINEVENALLGRIGESRENFAKVEIEMTGQYVTLRMTELPDGDNGGVV